jgi:hypothetical protein
LGLGGWVLGLGPKPQTPNPQSPIPNINEYKNVNINYIIIII